MTADTIRIIVHPVRNFLRTCNLCSSVVECCSLQDTAALDVNTSALAATDKRKNLARAGIRGQMKIFCERRSAAPALERVEGMKDYGDDIVKPPASSRQPAQPKTTAAYR